MPAVPPGVATGLAGGTPAPPDAQPGGLFTVPRSESERMINTMDKVNGHEHKRPEHQGAIHQRKAAWAVRRQSLRIKGIKANNGTSSQMRDRKSSRNNCRAILINRESVRRRFLSSVSDG